MPSLCLQVNNDGIISFTRPLAQYNPLLLPVNDDPLVVPYWSDVDTSGIGSVWYRLTSDPATLLEVRNKVRMYFPSDENFVPYEALVTTWEQVGYYNMRTDEVREWYYMYYMYINVGQYISMCISY